MDNCGKGSEFMGDRRGGHRGRWIGRANRGLARGKSGIWRGAQQHMEGGGQGNIRSSPEGKTPEVNYTRKELEALHYDAEIVGYMFNGTAYGVYTGPIKDNVPAESAAKDKKSGPVEGDIWRLEPLSTDEHLKDASFRRSILDSRNLVRMIGSSDFIDCRGLHPLLDVCQFCDGRRGAWARAKKSDENDVNGFEAYRQGVINSIPTD